MDLKLFQLRYPELYEYIYNKSFVAGFDAAIALRERAEKNYYQYEYGNNQPDQEAFKRQAQDDGPSYETSNK